MRYRPLVLVLVLMACEPPPSTGSGTASTSEDCTQLPYYRDSDGDGFGTATEQVSSCTRPSGYAANSDDCDDTNADANPNSRWFLDGDLDGFGDALQSLLQCDEPPGYVLNDSDCDDSDDTIGPGTIWYADTDLDGFGDASSTYEGCDPPADFVLDDSDCDDANAEISPNTLWYPDSDGDGFGEDGAALTQCTAPADHVLDNTDCDDADADAYPGATWYFDGDGDGYGTPSVQLSQCDRPAEYVGDDSDCDDLSAAVNPALVWYADTDGDGFGDPAVSLVQCVQPPAHVSNDQDCDDTDGSLSDTTNWYTDGDSDGYGGAVVGTGCIAPANSVFDGGDCDDVNPDFNPGQFERCDGLDNDCDANTTEIDVVSFESVAGVWTDESAVFGSGTVLVPGPWDSIEAGTLHVCEGDYTVQLGFTHDVVIEGPGETLASLSGGDRRTVIEVVGASVEIHNLTVKNGSHNPANGGLVTVNAGTVLVADCDFTADSSAITAILVENASVLTFERSVVRSALGYGLKITDSEAFFVDSEVRDNTAGSINALSRSVLTLTDTLVHSHSGLFETAVITDSDVICSTTTPGTFGFVDNIATFPGGALQFSAGATLSSTGCDWGVPGVDDNGPNDIVLGLSTVPVFNYGNDATFTCDTTACTP